MSNGSYAEPTPTAHFFAEAMVDHDAGCDLRLQRSTRCTCRGGPPSGYKDLPMEGPPLVLRRFDDDGAETGREAALAAENAALKRRLAELTGAPAGAGASGAGSLPYVPPARQGLRRLNGR